MNPIAYSNISEMQGPYTMTEPSFTAIMGPASIEHIGINTTYHQESQESQESQELHYIQKFKELLNQYKDTNFQDTNKEASEALSKEKTELEALMASIHQKFDIMSFMNSINALDKQIETKNKEIRTLKDALTIAHTFTKSQEAPKQQETEEPKETQENEYIKSITNNIDALTKKCTALIFEKQKIEDKLRNALVVMSTLRINKNLETLCGICQERNLTHTLECGHTYCKECIDKMKLTSAFCKSKSGKVIKLYI